MSPRTSLWLLCLAAVLGGVVVWLGSPDADPQRPGSQFVFEQDAREPSQLTSISLVTQEGVHVRAERRDDRWWIVEPIEAPGDEEVLKALAEMLAGFRSESVIESPPDAAIYGIVPESQAVRFTINGAERELQLGTKTPVGENSYVFDPASSRVLLVSTRDVDRLSFPFAALRDSRVSRFEPSEVNRVEVRSAVAAPVTLVRDSTGWRISDPLAVPADAGRVEELLAALAFLRAEAFVDGPAASEKMRDFVSEVEFVVQSETVPSSGDEGLTKRIVLAGSDGRPVRLVKGDREALFEVAAEDVFELPSTLDAFRQKSLSRFDPETVSFYEIVFRPPLEGAVTVGMERSQDGWRAMTPLAMAAGTSSRLLATLSDLDAVEIVAEGAGTEERMGLGLSPAAVTFRVFSGSEGEKAPERLAEVHLGRDEGVKGILAQRTGDPRVFRLSAERRRELPIDYGAFLEAFVSREPSPR